MWFLHTRERVAEQRHRRRLNKAKAANADVYERRK